MLCAAAFLVCFDCYYYDLNLFHSQNSTSHYLKKNKSSFSEDQKLEILNLNDVQLIVGMEIV